MNDKQREAAARPTHADYSQRLYNLPQGGAVEETLDLLIDVLADYGELEREITRLLQDKKTCIESAEQLAAAIKKGQEVA